MLDTYILLTKEIEAAELSLLMLRKEMQHLDKLLVGNVKDIQGIDYTRDVVQESAKIGYGDYIHRLSRLKDNEKRLKQHLEDLKNDMLKLEGLIKACRAEHASVIVHKFGNRLPHEKIAEKTGYSVSQVHRIIKKYT